MKIFTGLTIKNSIRIRLEKERENGFFMVFQVSMAGPHAIVQLEPLPIH